MIHRLVRAQHDPRSESIWLTIYADMITNLMLVFLALYGLTVMGEEAVETAMQSMTASVHQEAKQFDHLSQALRETVNVLPDVEVLQEAGAVRVRFGEAALFSSGSATLKSAAVEPLTSIGTLLKVLPQTIVVEGHTDSVPLAPGAAFKDNYELSLARSMAVVRLLIDKAGLPAGQAAAAAYGEHRPCATNDTPAGRARNRRVEIAIFRDFPFPDKGAAK
jgi:chemotaxis protein MotB